MVKASAGHKRGTRHKMGREVRDKFTIEKLIKEFKEDDKVIIALNPSSRRNYPKGTYQGLAGTVLGMRGTCCVVRVVIGQKEKTLIVSPDHLKTI